MASNPQGDRSALAAFNAELAKINIRGQWESEAKLHDSLEGPAPAGVSNVWHYADVMAAMQKARVEFPDSLNARRSLMFRNPGLPDSDATGTIGIGIQLIEPGELAWPHRHTATALRFVIEGDAKLATVIDGNRQTMESYDLILTPKWTWHGHHNQSDHPVTWVDVLDVGVVSKLNQMFYQASADTQLEGHVPAEEAKSPGPARSTRVSPIYRFAWKDTEPQLRKLAERNRVDPYDGIVYRYQNPNTGGPVLTTLDCRAHLLRPGDATKPIRRTSNAVHFVIGGKGQVVANGKALAFGKHDCFAVPSWSLYNIENASTSEEVILFSVNDRPLIEALDLYCERAN